MLPSGMILTWHSDIVNIPEGFALCDGNNGTPDLRGRFIVGAGDTYNPGDNGGSANHDHNFTGNGHFHILNAGPTVASGTTYQTRTDIRQVTGTTDNESNLPPYYALAYVMKL